MSDREHGDLRDGRDMGAADAPMSLEKVKLDYARQALERAHFDAAAAARMLDISEAELQCWIKKLEKQ